jgi:hypothetical protein
MLLETARKDEYAREEIMTMVKKTLDDKRNSNIETIVKNKALVKTWFVTDIERRVSVSEKVQER